VPQQVAAYWNLLDFGGVDPFQLRRYLPEFEAATGTIITGYTVTLPPYQGDPHTSNRNAQIDAARLAMWGVSHVVATYPIENTDLELVTQIDAAYIYRNRLQVSPLSTDSGSMCVGELYCYQARTVVPAALISIASLLLTVLFCWRGNARA
jgi:hypothetical protein